MNPNLAGILAMLMWSMTTTLLAFNKTIPPLELAALSWLLGFAVLGGYYLIKKEPMLLHWKRPLSDYAFASTGIFVYTALLYCAFHYAPPFEANALNYLWPILLMIFLGLFQKVPMTATKIFGMAVAFVGSVLLFVYRYNDTSTGELNIGHLFALSAAVVWSLYSCFAKTKNYPTIFLVPIFLVASIGSFVGHFLFEETIMPQTTGWIIIGMLGIFRISYVFWDYGIRNGDRVLLSSLSYLIPLIATLLLITAGFSSPNLGIMAGGLLIVLGCLTVNSKSLFDFIKTRIVK